MMLLDTNALIILMYGKLKGRVKDEIDQKG